MSDQTSTTFPLHPRILAALGDNAGSLHQLADQLDVTDARLQWHLFRLRECGDVRLVKGQWIRTPQGERSLEQFVVGPQGAIAPRIVVDFEQAFADAALGVFGAHFVQNGGEHRSRMSTAQATEFNDKLTTLITEYFGPGRGDRTGTKYGLHWVLTPIDVHPLGDR